jgi:methyl-accepting chemotaxis protein
MKVVADRGPRLQFGQPWPKERAERLDNHPLLCATQPKLRRLLTRIEPIVTTLRKPMKVSTRLILGFGATVAIGVGVAGYGALTMRSLSANINELAADHMVKVGQFSDILDNFNTIARSTRDIIISDDAALRDAAKKTIAETRVKNAEILAKLDKTCVTPKERELLKVVNETRAPYGAALERAMAAAIKGDKADAGAQLAGDVRSLQNVLFKAADDSRDQQQALADALAKEAASTVSFGMVLMVVLAVLMTAIGVAVGWLVTRSLTRALGAEPAELSSAVGRVAEGDLSQPLAAGGGGPPPPPAARPVGGCGSTGPVAGGLCVARLSCAFGGLLCRADPGLS